MQGTGKHCKHTTLLACNAAKGEGQSAETQTCGLRPCQGQEWHTAQGFWGESCGRQGQDVHALGTQGQAQGEGNKPKAKVVNCIDSDYGIVIIATVSFNDSYKSPTLGITLITARCHAACAAATSFFAAEGASAASSIGTLPPLPPSSN